MNITHKPLRMRDLHRKRPIQVAIESQPGMEYGSHDNPNPSTWNISAGEEPPWLPIPKVELRLVPAARSAGDIPYLAAIYSLALCIEELHDHAAVSSDLAPSAGLTRQQWLLLPLQEARGR